MATTIEKTALSFNTASAVAAGVLTDGTGRIAYDADDAKILILFENTSDADPMTVTVKKGNGLQGTADLAVTIPKEETHAVVVESGKYVNTSGSDKGYLVFTADASYVKARCIALP